VTSWSSAWATAGRARDDLIAFAIPALYYLAYFGTLAVTTGIGWTVHLWLGATVLVGVIGLALNELVRLGAVAERSSS
jgi:hypothetical protein